MKAISLCCTLLLFFVFAQSQNQLAIFAGPQATTVKYTVTGKKQDVTMKYGFHAGMLMKVPFEGNVYFAPAAMYSMTGYKVKFTEYANPPSLDAADNDVTIHTFQLAGLIQVDLGKKPAHFFLKTGPTLDFQLFGKEKFNLKTTGSVSRNMSWGPVDYGRYGANFLFQLGYETGSFLVSAHYSHGLTTISNADFGPNILHRAFGISVGTYLKRKKIIIDTRNRE